MPKIGAMGIAKIQAGLVFEITVWQTAMATRIGRVAMVGSLGAVGRMKSSMAVTAGTLAVVGRKINQMVSAVGAALVVEVVGRVGVAATADVDQVDVDQAGGVVHESGAAMSVLQRLRSWPSSHCMAMRSSSRSPSGAAAAGGLALARSIPRCNCSKIKVWFKAIRPRGGASTI